MTARLQPVVLARTGELTRIRFTVFTTRAQRSGARARAERAGASRG